MKSCQLRVKFQGGFVGSVMTISVDDSSGQQIYKQSFYPDDINDMQTFSLADDPSTKNTLINAKKLSIVFEKSSDFFGRIIIYHLELLA